MCKIKKKQGIKKYSLKRDKQNSLFAVDIASYEEKFLQSTKTLCRIECESLCCKMSIYQNACSIASVC